MQNESWGCLKRNVKICVHTYMSAHEHACTHTHMHTHIYHTPHTPRTTEQFVWYSKGSLLHSRAKVGRRRVERGSNKQ